MKTTRKPEADKVSSLRLSPLSIIWLKTWLAFESFVTVCVRTAKAEGCLKVEPWNTSLQRHVLVSLAGRMAVSVRRALRVAAAAAGALGCVLYICCANDAIVPGHAA